MAVMTDARGEVRAALATIEARCMVRGIDLVDYKTLVDSVATWEDYWQQWTLMGERYLALADRHEAAGWLVSAGAARVRAGVAFHFGKALAIEDDARYRDLTTRSVEAVAAGQKLVDPTFERIEVPFDGHYVVGNLRRPKGVERPPLAILVPGTESTKEEFPRWEDEFLTRGMATLSMDGPGQGEVGFELRIRHDYEHAVTALLDALEPRTDLDLSRVAAAGVSLGGYYSIRAAAFEPRIKAVLANCGPWSLGEAWSKIFPIYVAKYVWNFGASSEEDARERAHALTLEGVAQRVQAPTLVVFGAADLLFDAEREGQRTADALPNGELWMFQGGNHGVTNFATEHLGPGADWLLAHV
jgi:dienelactone hydrolase